MVGGFGGNVFPAESVGMMAGTPAAAGSSGAAFQAASSAVRPPPAIALASDDHEYYQVRRMLVDSWFCAVILASFFFFFFFFFKYFLNIFCVFAIGLSFITIFMSRRSRCVLICTTYDIISLFLWYCTVLCYILLN